MNYSLLSLTTVALLSFTQTPAVSAATCESTTPEGANSLLSNSEQCINGIQIADEGDAFDISLEGVSIVAPKDSPTQTDEMRRTDIALDNMKLDIRFDGFEAQPYLNIMATKANKEGDITFLPYWNYSAWIETAEIRIFPLGESTLTEPLRVLPIDIARPITTLLFDAISAEEAKYSNNTVGDTTNQEPQIQYVLRSMMQKEPLMKLRLSACA